MNIINPPIEGLLILQPKMFGDARGFFMESFNQRAFDAAVGKPVQFVQDNHSRSSRGVLRGLHYQLGDAAQGKLVRVTAGCVWDVAVDMRRQSPTYGQWHGVQLSGDNNTQFWIPAGFAHGFVVLSETADFLYKTDNYYNPAQERCVRWDDPALNISWPLGQLNGAVVNVSDKDAKGALFAVAESF